jgi:DNA-binding XRE family transcriptional regulator
MHKIREYREKSGLSQSEMARRTGVSQPTYRAYEVKGQMPNIHIARRLVKALNGAKIKCKLDDVFPPEEAA